MGGMLDACRRASGSDARFTWVPEAFLAARGVLPWSHLPLWMPPSQESHRAFHRVDIGRALAAGLAFRPLEGTARDTLAWQRANEGRPAPDKAGVPIPDETLRPEREAELLAEWHRRPSGGA
jgi:2'-hydroxyisoflavone reductase